MPHCEHSLYHRLLSSSWNKSLNRTFLIGNSFHAYAFRYPPPPPLPLLLSAGHCRYVLVKGSNP